MKVPFSAAQDPYEVFISSRWGKQIAHKVGLPIPPHLERYDAMVPVPHKAVVLGGKGCIAETFPQILGKNFLADEIIPRVAAVFFDASGIDNFADTGLMAEFIRTHLARLDKCGRIVVFGFDPEMVESPNIAIIQRGLLGFIKSLAKELRYGSTAQLVYMSPQISSAVEVQSTVDFLLSPKSAFVDGQAIFVDKPMIADVASGPAALSTSSHLSPLAVVTGAARGIGEVIARTLHREGARVVLVDIPGNSEVLRDLARELSESFLAVDITSADAPQKIYAHTQELGGIDILVHNAGITQDKLLFNMNPEQWQSVIKVNIQAPVQMTDYLLAQGGINVGGKIIGVSSIAGIAGNAGQTNYAFTKAAMIGFVETYTASLREKNMTINAVVPGFIETAMTAKIPLKNRELGRLGSSLLQGGLPIDIAEGVAYFAASGSSGVTGNCLRICGQNILGA